MAKEVWNEEVTTDDAMAAHADKDGGQILICVAGRGYYQKWGEDVVEMKSGDVINIPVGVKHWHGAALDSWFSHLAVEVPRENGSNKWPEAVTDEQYGKWIRTFKIYFAGNPRPINLSQGRGGLLLF